MRLVRRSESGAVAVEAALLLPLISLILLGIVEFGLLFRDVLTVQTAARDAARTASAHSREANYAELAVDRVTEAMSIRGLDARDRILIYKAETNGLPAGATSAENAIDSCSDATNCQVWAIDSSGVFQPLNTGWKNLDQNACPEEQDYVGVIVSLSHPFITGTIGDIMTGGDGTGRKTVLEKVVMRLEPRSAAGTDCKPSS